MVDLSVLLDQYGLIVCSEDWQVTEQSAPVWRLYVVYGGQTEYQGQEGSFELQSDCLYLFPHNWAYSMRHNPQDPLRCLWFHILISPPPFIPLLRLELQTHPVVTELVRALHIAVAEEMNETVLTKLLESLVFMVFYHSSISKAANANLVKAIDIMHGQYASNLKTLDVAKASGYSPSHFVRLFKGMVGLTPQEYLSSIRLAQARVLLRKGFPVSGAALSVGYQDAKAFSRAFKRIYGVPPSRFAEEKSYGQP